MSVLETVDEVTQGSQSEMQLLSSQCSRRVNPFISVCTYVLLSNALITSVCISCRSVGRRLYELKVEVSGKTSTASSFELGRVEDVSLKSLGGSFRYDPAAAAAARPVNMPDWRGKSSEQWRDFRLSISSCSLRQTEDLD